MTRSPRCLRPAAWIRACGLSVLAVLAGLSTPAAADCAAAGGRFQAALAAGDTERLRGAAKAIQGDPFCDGGLRQATGRETAFALAWAARTLPAGEQRAVLEEALNFARPWPVVAQLGAHHYDARDYATAQRLLEEALTTMADRGLSPEGPPPEAILGIRALASQARLLADSPQPPPMRGEQPAGLALGSIRGVTVAPAPVPVRFEHDRAVFTPQGRQDAAFLRDYLRRFGDPPVTLVGHTDPTGGDGYNCRLAWKRVTALSRHLQSLGYRGVIATHAMGMRQPLDLYDASRHSQEEIHRMLRRVEYIEAANAPEPPNACPRP